MTTIGIDLNTTNLPEVGETGGICPDCGARLEIGYGLAGGGCGVYEFCENCETIVTKDQDSE